jgi:ATP synthase F1 delta subunit
MLNGAVTNRYTQGLYASAAAKGVVDAVDEGLKLFVDTLGSHSELKTLIEHPVLPAEQKAKLVSDVFGDKLHPVLTRFLTILFARKRYAYIASIYEKFHQLAEEGKGQVTVRVESAQELTADQTKGIEDKLSSLLGKKARISVTVNPNLIAGYRAIYGNRVLDATVLGALNQFGQKLATTAAKGSIGR